MPRKKGTSNVSAVTIADIKELVNEYWPNPIPEERKQVFLSTYNISEWAFKRRVSLENKLKLSDHLVYSHSKKVEVEIPTESIQPLPQEAKGKMVVTLNTDGTGVASIPFKKISIQEGQIVIEL